MRLLGLAVLLLLDTAQAQPTCPFDAKVRALADDPAGLEAIAKVMRARRDVKEWIAATDSRCTFVTTPRFVRTLEGLSQRCASALVELEFKASTCKDLRIYNGGGPSSAYGLVAANAKGKLEVVSTLFHFDLEQGMVDAIGLHVPDVFVPSPPPIAPRVECARSLDTRDGGTNPLLAIASDPSLRFDGCTLRGVPEATVRQAMQGVLGKGDSPSATCQFFEGEAVIPTCAVTTELTEDRVAIISSGGFEPGGAMIRDPPRFTATRAYLELADAGHRWLCSDLALEAECAPLKLPPAARPGCTPPLAKRALLERAVEKACASKRDAWRRDLPLVATPGAALQVERLVLDRGLGIINEEELAAKVVESATALAQCARAVTAWDGAVGRLITAEGRGVVVYFPEQPGDEDCVKSAVLDRLRAFRANVPRNWSVSTYEFRLGLVRQSPSGVEGGQPRSGP